MTDISFIPALVAFAFVTSVTPGPNNLMVMASGANHGIRRTVPHMLGIAGGFALMIALVGCGLIGAFDAVPILQTVLKVASIVYLLYLALKIATASPPVPRSGPIDAAMTTGKPLTFLQAAAFQWVNPKAWTMALAALSVYAPTRTVFAIMFVAAIFGIVSLPSIGVWAILGQGLQGFLASKRSLRIFNILMALLLVATLYPVIFV